MKCFPKTTKQGFSWIIGQLMKREPVYPLFWQCCVKVVVKLFKTTLGSLIRNWSWIFQSPPLLFVVFKPNLLLSLFPLLTIITHILPFSYLNYYHSQSSFHSPYVIWLHMQRFPWQWPRVDMNIDVVFSHWEGIFKPPFFPFPSIIIPQASYTRDLWRFPHQENLGQLLSSELARLN